MMMTLRIAGSLLDAGGVADVLASSAPGEVARVGSQRLFRRGELVELEGAVELVNAGCKPLEANFEPVERSVRLVHGFSFRPRARARIRGSNDRIV
jgi:hypothetical protein